ncbi:DUF3883 domain-containing protein [Streptomyces sp. NPDC020707]|uniref:DUF3883 domain-containing protein n=1 Tax=Streptomyces sp. NPDC020707 TaxID=3365084 RepID=UPI00378B3520
MQPSEGARRAALRWLDLLPVADVPRARAVLTHHPDYADLTPSQYAEGLAWLRRVRLLDRADRPVLRVSEHEASDERAASRIAHTQWSEEAEAARRTTGTAGEAAIAELLTRGGAREVVHVALLTDVCGYDVEAVSPTGAPAHVEVKATTNPTRLVIHLSRNEYDVMCRDPDWLLVAVLVGKQDEALNVVTVDTEWLRQRGPADRDRRVSWESARYRVPGHALTPGLRRSDGIHVIPKRVSPVLPVWGVSSSPAWSA